MPHVSLHRPRLFAAATVVELVRLERNARRAPEAVRADQLIRLRAAVESARAAPFWKTHLEPLREVRDLSDLELVATTDKALLRTAPQPDRLIATVPAGTRTLETSGTSGEAFEVHYGPRAAWWQGVLRLRSTRWRGLQPWHRTASLTLRHERVRTEGIAGTVRRSRGVHLPVDLDMDELARRVIDSRPASLSGHPHLLIELGHELRGRVQVRAITTHGETLTPETRSEIRTLFGAEPCDSYGTAECGFIATQCHAADLYHVNHEAVVVELLDDDDRPVRPGEIGSIALTSMWNPLMPFIRYRIGDSAVFAQRPCRCGSALPALTSLLGRTMNWIVDANGRRVAPQRMWVSLFLGDAALVGITRYRVQQDETRRVTIELVANGRFGDDLVDRWVAGYRDLLGDVPVEFQRVDHIDIRPDEKFEIISSRAVPAD